RPLRVRVDAPGALRDVRDPERDELLRLGRQRAGLERLAIELEPGAVRLGRELPHALELSLHVDAVEDHRRLSFRDEGWPPFHHGARGGGPGAAFPIGPAPMGLRLSPAEEAFCAEVSRWLDANVPPDFDADHFEFGMTADERWDWQLAWHRRLHAGGWV